ncbi:MAG: glucose dehydrogenase [Chloroflexia bacterium]|nr:glucose dehydrogenase [Chloroflexia bacterium]
MIYRILTCFVVLLLVSGCQQGVPTAPRSYQSPTITPAHIRLTLVRAQIPKPGLIFALPDGNPAVIEQRGRIVDLADGRVWLDVQSLVAQNSPERGLLGVAISSDRMAVFVSYTRVSDFATVVGRMPLHNGAPDVTQIKDVIVIPQPFANHNGGHIAFGPDELLYIGTGDGGSANDPQQNGQNPRSLLGKMLRIDVRDPQVAYTIPVGQPVHSDWLPEVWAIGLRNPWRFGFDGQSQMFIADVGQNRFEELNVLSLTQLGGANFGWNVREGNDCLVGESCASSGMTGPVMTYPHTEGRCSITGGLYVANHALPAVDGALIYADFCAGTIYRYDRMRGQTLVLDTSMTISSFGSDGAGRVYVADYDGGAVYELVEDS